jgi:peptide deformylase
MRGTDMPVEPIQKYLLSESLQQRSEPVEEITDEIRALVETMIHTMYDTPGIGLAAPQIGVNKRVFVIDTTVGEDPEALIVMINPEILATEGTIEEEEGCLSVPEFRSIVKRPAKVVVRGLNLDGEVVEITGEGLLARAISHEMDHLDGKLFLDRLGVIKRDLIRRKIRKRIKTGQWS